MTQLNFNIRPLQEKDFPEWLRLRKQLWDQTTDAEHREEMLDILDHNETQLILVVEIMQNRLVGFLEASIRPFVEDCHSDHVGYLEGWFVEKDYRRHGIGRMLVKKAEEWARGKGCEEMASDSEVGNELSFKAHLQLGYEETSRLIHLRKDLV